MFFPSAHSLDGARLRARLSLIGTVALLVAACGGGGGGGGGGVATTPMSGTLSAPGGALAFNARTGPQRLLAEFFGRDAWAALTGTSPVAGATVKLIQIDGTDRKSTRLNSSHL